MYIPVLSRLPGYTDVAQTVLVILAMMGLFPDRPRVSVCVCVLVHLSQYLSLDPGSRLGKSDLFAVKGVYQQFLNL